MSTGSVFVGGPYCGDRWESFHDAPVVRYWRWLDGEGRSRLSYHRYEPDPETVRAAEICERHNVNFGPGVRFVHQGYAT